MMGLLCVESDKTVVSSKLLNSCIWPNKVASFPDLPTVHGKSGASSLSL